MALAVTIFLFALVTQGESAQASYNPRLVISEVHPNAISNGASLETHEWIEIHNPERYAVNLHGWTVEDAQSISMLPDFDIAAGETVLIVGSSAEISLLSGTSLIILDSARIGGGLRNAGDRVALVNPYGVRHDAVSWGDVHWPQTSQPPDPGQSIIRTRNGGQTLSSELTPWTLGAPVSARPKQYRHPRPDTAVRITSEVVNPADNQPESVTLKNVSDEPMLTVNWTLTVGASLVKLRSLRIEPGESVTITEPDGKIGGGLAARGGHLVLRDAQGNWLSTASWGNDHTFHTIPLPPNGAEVRFNPLLRVHPSTPWYESIDFGTQRMISSEPSSNLLIATNVSAAASRPHPVPAIHQQADAASIWISEVYPTAGQGRNDPAFEWFELTNPTDRQVDLSGWSIADNTSTDPLDQVIIPPNSSIAIGTSDQASVVVVVAITDGRIGNGLANAGDQLRLINPAGEVVNAISWGNDQLYSSVRTPKADESIHRAAPDSNPIVGLPSAGVLTSSVNASTNPGPASSAPTESVSASTVPPVDDEAGSETANTTQSATRPRDSLSPPILRVTEILPAPLAGQAEWVEIHNPTDSPIDLSGWAIGDPERRTALSGIIAPRSRFVISTQELESATAGLIVDRIGNGLNNDADTIAIFNPDGVAVHEIRYGDDALPAPERGLSLALDPERWVVTAEPTPGSAEVTPLLSDALRSAAMKAPVSDEGRLPVTQTTENGGSDAWMIVSFALIGVILTLVLRRWRPDEPVVEQAPEPVTYSGPSTTPLTTREEARSDGRAEQ